MGVEILTSNGRKFPTEINFVDVCGRCCVIEEFPLRGVGSSYLINEI